MITLTAKIDFLSNQSMQLITSQNFIGNNVSAEIENVIEKKIKSDNPFLLGSSKLGENFNFCKDVNYFIGNQLSDVNGNFPLTYRLELEAVSIPHITIAFDTINNYHPKYITVNGVTYYDDDSIFTISNIGSQDKCIIEISNWNVSNSPLIITGLYTEITINIDKHNLISLNREIFDRSDIKLPEYGIISNTGSLNFNDLDGEIKDYVSNGYLSNDLKVQITLINTLTKKQEKIGEFQTDNWDYDNDNRNVSVSLKDDLEEWQDIEIVGIDYDVRKPFAIISEGKMSNLYIWLYKKTPSGYEMLSFEELDEETKNVLENTRLEYPILKIDSLWNQWTKLCKVCQLHIYKNNSGRTVCKYNGGN